MKKFFIKKRKIEKSTTTNKGGKVLFSIKDGEIHIDMNLEELKDMKEEEILSFDSFILKNGQLIDGWLIQLEKSGDEYKLSAGGEYLGCISKEEIIPSLKLVLTF